MSALEIYNQRFADGGQRVFALALDGARRRGQNYVRVEHFIEALGVVEEWFFRFLTNIFEIDPEQVQTLIAKRLEIFTGNPGGGLRLAPATVALLNQAWKEARNDHRMKIESFDLFKALSSDNFGLLVELFDGLNAKDEAWVTFTYDERAQMR